MVKTNRYTNTVIQSSKKSKSNIKSRLGIRTNPTNVGKAANKTGILKKVEQAGPGQRNEIKLFTKHFDARNKIKNHPKNNHTKQNDTKIKGNGIAKVSSGNIFLLPLKHFLHTSHCL